MSINHPHTHIYPTDTLWHWKDSFQRLTQHSKKKALNLESGVPSIFLLHFYLNFSMRFIYTQCYESFFRVWKHLLGPPFTGWLCTCSVKSWYKYTFLLTEFIDKTFYVFASWTWDKSSIERPRLIPVYLTNTSSAIRLEIMSEILPRCTTQSDSYNSPTVLLCSIHLCLLLIHAFSITLPTALIKSKHAEEIVWFKPSVSHGIHNLL